MIPVYDRRQPRAPQLAAVEERYLGRLVIIPSGTAIDGDKRRRSQRALTVRIRQLSFGSEGLFLGWGARGRSRWVAAEAVTVLKEDLDSLRRRPSSLSSASATC
jgi:hypothetical protein